MKLSDEECANMYNVDLGDVRLEDKELVLQFGRIAKTLESYNNKFALLEAIVRVIESIAKALWKIQL